MKDSLLDLPSGLRVDMEGVCHISNPYYKEEKQRWVIKLLKINKYCTKFFYKTQEECEKDWMCMVYDYKQITHS